ncbi:MAG: hypothetical protein HKN84_10320 [Gammaproteobacteria bacterium]|nr:hypothetical protein [Gammaproteobacteria bacterium]
MRRAGLFIVTLCFAAAAAAHHSPNLHFDRNDIAAISGEIAGIAWRNPHTELIVSALDENGQPVSWVIDTRSASQFLRAGLNREMFQVGDPIRVAGFRGRRNRNAIFSTNILLADGRELVADNFAAARWSPERAVMLVSGGGPAQQGDAPSSDARGIFRVWSRDRSDHGIQGTGRSLWLDSYPLTGQSRAVQESWDRIADNPYIRCETGMPAIMDLGTPMEFVQEGDDIVLYLEEQDTVRRIHMSNSAEAEGATPLGHSMGRWEGSSLVISTTDVNWPWFDQSGVPQSREVQFAERFTPSPDGRVLNYSITVTDPATFTEAVTLERYWIWVPGEQIRPYDCTWDRDDL